MSFKLKIAAFLGIAFLSILCACSVNGASDTIPTPPWNLETSTQDSLPVIDVEEDELEDNYFLLATYYLWAPEELKEIEAYRGQGLNHGYSYGIDHSFPDVEYMYSQMTNSYTNYYDPYYSYQMALWLYYSEWETGIGAEIEELENEEGETQLIVTQVYSMSPAYKAGLQKGDVIVAVGKSAPGNLKDFEKLTHGAIGDEIRLTISRNSQEITLKIILDQFIMPTVYLDSINAIPVIRITEFSDTTSSKDGTYGEFLEALAETEGAKSTIIDLRGNGGGSVVQCLNIAAELLDKGDTIIREFSTDFDEETKDRYIDSITWTTKSNGIARDRYYVVLADTGTASCSEIMMAAIIANHQSPVIGLRTYGKGIAQSYIFTKQNGIAQITSSQFFDKNNQSYHDLGILPDYEISDSPKALAKAAELAQQRSAKRNAGYGTHPLNQFKKHLAKSKARNRKNLERGAFRIKTQSGLSKQH